MKFLGLSSDSLMVMVAFVGYLAGVMVLGIWSHRLVKKGNFVKNYFVGGRQLAWVLALSVAGTAISGGSFTGFPALTYTNGWVMALWIASYMVVPLTAMALMGKRLNQVARVSGSVTVPDVFRDRFNSPTLGLTATLLIFGFLVFNMVAQFKSGGLVLRTALGLPKHDLVIPVLGGTIDRGYLIGLCIFAFTVVAYTTYGGFWAVTWTDVLEGIVKIVGVTMLAILAVRAVADVPLPNGETATGLTAASERLRQQDPALVEGPGPASFLPLPLAFSFFLMWSLSSAGQPSGMVRLMSFRDSPSLRKAMIVVCGYYAVTYSCLVIIFICGARAIYPTEFLKSHGGIPDSVMPEMARRLAPHPLIAGMLLASPFAAVMSAVAAFLLVISSSLVRDIYQRTINPHVSAKKMKWASYTVTTLIGVGVLIAALKPPDFLQYLIVFTGTGQSCSFLFPMLGCLYWKRATKAGILAGMLGGGMTVLSLYVVGWTLGGEGRHDHFAPHYLYGFDPLVWGLSTSLVFCVTVSLLTRTEPEQVEKYFPGK